MDYICRYRQFLLFRYLLAFFCFATFETLIELYYFFVYFCKLIMTGEPVHITSNRRMAPEIPYNILHLYVHPTISKAKCYYTLFSACYTAWQIRFFDHSSCHGKYGQTSHQQTDLGNLYASQPQWIDTWHYLWKVMGHKRQIHDVYTVYTVVC